MNLTACIQIYYSTGNGDKGHDAPGWYVWAANNGDDGCWYGDPDGPFVTPGAGLKSLAAELDTFIKAS